MPGGGGGEPALRLSNSESSPARKSRRRGRGKGSGSGKGQGNGNGNEGGKGNGNGKGNEKGNGGGERVASSLDHDVEVEQGVQSQMGSGIEKGKKGRQRRLGSACEIAKTLTQHLTRDHQPTSSSSPSSAPSSSNPPDSADPSSSSSPSSSPSPPTSFSSSSQDVSKFNGFLIRPYAKAMDKSNANVQVISMWVDGFLEMASEFTRYISLPVAVTIFVVGATLMPYFYNSIFLRYILLSIPFLILGMVGLHYFLLRKIQAMCRSTVETGDMRSIYSFWCRPKLSQFMIAIDSQTGLVIGCIGVKMGGRDDEKAFRLREIDLKHVASVYKLSVLANYRHRGVARALMQAAERWARENLSAASMQVVTGNSAAKRLYERLGYVRVGGLEYGCLPSYFEKKL